ncbi:hypothetical protein BTO02_16480 [Paraburkholderia sp. SOS3]|nr:hypothetical protein BTO02_16480 [Paraburkholderia sp. SOS3]
MRECAGLPVQPASYPLTNPTRFSTACSFMKRFLRPVVRASDVQCVRGFPRANPLAGTRAAGPVIALCALAYFHR